MKPAKSKPRAKPRSVLETILLVEDNPMVRAMLVRVLSQSGYAVHEAETGEQALTACGLARPDLVILDDRLPGIGGIEVATVLHTSLRIPFMVLTANCDTRQLKKYIALGASNYMIKPVTAENIVPAVQLAFHNGSNINRLVEKSLQDNYIGRGIACLALTRRLDEALALAELKSMARNERKKLWIKAKEIFDQSIGRACRG